MEPITPRMTIQNTDSKFWLVTLEHEFNDEERMTITVRIPSRNVSISDVEGAVLERARHLLVAKFVNT